MKILGVTPDNRKRVLTVKTSTGTFEFPYSRMKPSPSVEDRIEAVYVDKELGEEAVTYELQSGREGTVHIDHVLDFNRDPGYLADLLLYKLTVEAAKRLEGSGIGIRQLARRLKTSPSQVYRLLDTTNYRKSIRQMLGLLAALDCEVDLVVRNHEAM